jgi:hypothetical protein
MRVLPSVGVRGIPATNEGRFTGMVPRGRARAEPGGVVPGLSEVFRTAPDFANGERARPRPGASRVSCARVKVTQA